MGTGSGLCSDTVLPFKTYSFYCELFQKVADSLADPIKYDNLFPGYTESLKVGQREGFD